MGFQEIRAYDVTKLEEMPNRESGQLKHDLERRPVIRAAHTNSPKEGE